MARADSDDADAADREIRLLKNPDGQWTARDLGVDPDAARSQDDGLHDILQ